MKVLRKALLLIALLIPIALSTHSTTVTSNATGWLTVLNQNYYVNYNILNNGPDSLNMINITVYSSNLTFSNPFIDAPLWICGTSGATTVNCSNSTLASGSSLNINFDVSSNYDGNYTIYTNTTDTTGYNAATITHLAFDSTPPSTVSNLINTSITKHNTTLNWTAASDTGSRVSYYQVFRDTTMFTTTDTNYTDGPLSAGTTYIYNVAAVDYAGNVGTNTSLTVTTMSNLYPLASFTANPTSGTAPLSVSFTSTSSDPDGTIVSYAWNFGDGGIGSGVTTSHTYNTPGTYTATLSVTDDDGAMNSSQTGITVTSAGGGGGGGGGGGSGGSGGSGSNYTGVCVGVCVNVLSPTEGSTVDSPFDFEVNIQNVDSCDLKLDGTSILTIDSSMIQSDVFTKSLTASDGAHTFTIKCSQDVVSKTRTVTFTVQHVVPPVVTPNNTNLVLPSPASNQTTNATENETASGGLSGFIQSAYAQPLVGIGTFIAILLVGAFFLAKNNMLPEKLRLPSLTREREEPQERREDEFKEGYRRPGLDVKKRTKGAVEDEWVRKDIDEEEKRIKEEEDRLTELRKRLDQLKKK